MFNKEANRVHVGYVDLLAFFRNCENALRETLSVETSTNPPFSCLLVAADRSTSEKDARAITTIQVEDREAKVKRFTSISIQINALLLFPFFNTYRDCSDGLDEPIWFAKDSVPEGGNAMVFIVQVKLRDDTFTKEA